MKNISLSFFSSIYAFLFLILTKYFCYPIPISIENHDETFGCRLWFRNFKRSAGFWGTWGTEKVFIEICYLVARWKAIWIRWMWGAHTSCKTADWSFKHVGRRFRCHRNATQVRCTFIRNWFILYSCTFKAFLGFFSRLKQNTQSFSYIFAIIAR